LDSKSQKDAHSYSLPQVSNEFWNSPVVVQFVMYVSQRCINLIGSSINLSLEKGGVNILTFQLDVHNKLHNDRGFLNHRLS
jgi:hypothetical protein